MSKISIDVLHRRSKDVLETLTDLPLWMDFYLAGGSGLALQIRHRLSMDLDLFSYTNKLGDQERRRLHETLAKSGKTTTRVSREETLEVAFNEVVISFFHYDYPLVEPLKEVNSIKIASIADIGLMKLAAIIGRGSKKDFVDSYFILKEHIGLEKLLLLSKKKFKDVPSFDVQAIRALVYFKDAEAERMPKMIREVKWTEIKRFLLNEVKDTSKKLISKEV